MLLLLPRCNSILRGGRRALSLGWLAGLAVVALPKWSHRRRIKLRRTPHNPKKPSLLGPNPDCTVCTVRNEDVFRQRAMPGTPGRWCVRATAREVIELLRALEKAALCGSAAVPRVAQCHTQLCSQKIGTLDFQPVVDASVQSRWKSLRVISLRSTPARLLS